MGFRIRKSFKIAPGVRFNISKSGVGTSLGVRGARYSIHSSGRRTTSVGIPGTGMSYVQSSNGTTSRRASSKQPTQAQGSLKKPGLFASKGEKLLYKAVSNGLDLALLDEVAEHHPNYRWLALTFAGLKRAEDDAEKDTAINQLQEVFQKQYEPTTDKFTIKYLSRSFGTVNIAPGITASLPISRGLIGLMLAELQQRSGKLDQAIITVEQLEPSTYAAVSLVELYTQDGRNDEAIKLTNGVTNADEASTLLLTYRGIALGREKHIDAALQAFKEALRFRSRPSEMRQLALFERAKVLIGAGKQKAAKGDLEKIMAEDATYPGLNELFNQIPG